MTCNWIEIPLGDFIELKRGYDLPKSKRLKGDKPIISSAGLSDYHSESKVTSPGVVTGRYGTIGEVFYVEEDFWPLNTTLYVKDFKGNCPEFVYYLLKTFDFHKYSDKAAVPGVNRNHLHMEKVCVPSDYVWQERIASYISKFDKKITLNAQTNQTLEEMAQAIFKSWFVDFDPVKAKMHGEQPEGMDAITASLFPEKLVESELGELPEGWKLVPVGDLLANAIGGDWGKEVPDEKHTEEVRIVRGTDIPKLHGGAIDSVPVRYVESKKLKTRKLERGDIVIEVSGGSKDQPTGRSLFISDNILKRLDLPSEPASFCRRFKPVSYEIGLLLAVHFQLMYQAGKTWEYQNQSTGISNFQTKYFLEAEHVVIPSEDVLEAFIKQVNPMMDMIHSNQNIDLAKLRDTLLPKLLSGEIELDKVLDV
ncbi:type I restriction enzyme, S subunit [Vibrio crassostreae]|nr:type I restriction enzyme, S subunit [Vibrio crassostreae]CAK3028648.1 type I restriction enzyme, S subunit [Vibrio crassostreae]